MGNLKFNGVSTVDLGLIIQTQPAYVFPSKDVATSHVPGRNGDLIIDQESYTNVDRTYALASVYRPGTDFISNAQQVLNWLNSASGYARIEDSYDPEVYRMGVYKGGGELTDLYTKATTLNAVFNCKPQRYLKSGELEVEFAGSEIEIINPTDQKSLPKITISGLTKTGDNDVLLVTVSKNSGIVVSSISLTSVPSTTIVIDSDIQTTYDDTKIDMNQYVGLNGKDFPSLSGGKNIIKVKKYSEKSTYLQKYNDIVTAQQQVCNAKYQPFDTLVTAKQKKFYFKSYNNLKTNNAEVYTAKAYQLYMSEQASSYTFISYNTVLEKSCQSIMFSGTDNIFPSWLSVTQVTETLGNSTKTYNVCNANTNGFYIVTGDKYISYHSSGNLLIKAEVDKSITIVYYPSKMINGLPEIDVNYTDKPDWIKCVFGYNSNDTQNIEGRYLKEIDFVITVTGYFWKDKEGLFTSASWNKYVYDNENPVVLGSLAWSTYKLAFISYVGLSTAVNTSYTYKYLLDLIQYKDVVATSTDSSGNTTNTITNKVHFVVSGTEDPNVINYKAAVGSAGYYRCNTSADTNWLQVNEGGIISDASHSTADANTVYYLNGAPDYSKETNFPIDWLSPLPIKTGTSSINPDSISGYLVNVTGWYRSSTADSSGNQVYTTWVKLNAGEQIIINMAPDKDYYIYYIMDMPTVYDHNMSFNDTAVPPSWLKVEYITDPVTTKVSTKFSANQDGYYKWDANTAWVYLTSGKEIVSSGATNDTTIYYMQTLAAYQTFDLYTINIKTNSGGDPQSVEIMAKVAGYYRSNKDTNWSYFSIGDLVLDCKTSDVNTIYNLEESSETLDNLIIKIIPRWWKL